MSLIKEYIDRKLGIQEFENELRSLVKRYNQLTGRYLFIYAGATVKQGIPTLNQPILSNETESQVLVSFVESTKDGKFAIIEKYYIYPRMEEQAESLFSEEEYFYSIR